MSGTRVEVRVEDAEDDAEIEVIGIRVQPGAHVEEGETLLEVATDKANMEILAPVAGSVAEIMVAEGDIVVGDRVLVVIIT